MNDLPCNYVLCSNPRSGTTLLCTMLADTGVAGCPNSFFRQEGLQEWAQDWGIDAEADPMDPAFSSRYLLEMQRAGRGKTSVFGLRLMGPDLRFACDWLNRLYPGLPSDLARLQAAFGPLRFIHLTRQDKLAEAVSYVKAEQSGVWHRNADGSIHEALAPNLPDGFNVLAIHERLNMLRHLDVAWHAWFAAENIAPLRLTYESLSDDPQAILADVLSHIGQDPALAAGITLLLRKLADQTSSDWIARYRQIYPDR